MLLVLIKRQAISFICIPQEELPVPQKCPLKFDKSIGTNTKKSGFANYFRPIRRNIKE